jgi:periplasmic protein CpxP/Spy
MTRIGRWLAVGALAVPLAVHAQVERGQPVRPRGERQAQAGGANRQRLEREIQRRMAVIVQRQLNLSPAQMQKLQDVNRRFEGRRRELLMSEREARQGLRQALTPGDSADDRRVSDLMDQMLRVQRERVDLLSEEQRELSAFLTPMQRARYFALQERVRRQVEEFRRQQGQRPGPGRALP